jgi:hypothetical protein
MIGSKTAEEEEKEEEEEAKKRAKEPRRLDTDTTKS